MQQKQTPDGIVDIGESLVKGKTLWKSSDLGW